LRSRNLHSLRLRGGKTNRGRRRSAEAPRYGTYGQNHSVPPMMSHTQYQLSGLSRVLSTSHDLVDREIKHRLATGDSELQSFSVDFGILHDFLVKPGDQPTCGSVLVESLLGAHGVQFTLPPGAVHAFLRFCYDSTAGIPSVASGDELVAWLKQQARREPSPRLDLDQALQARLRTLVDHVQAGRQHLKRLSALLAADNLASHSACGIRPWMLVRDPSLPERTHRLFVRTAQSRRGSSDQLYHQEVSLNLAFAYCLNSPFCYPRFPWKNGGESLITLG